MVEDSATHHSHGFQQDLYLYSEIQKFLWPGNFPDINIFEPVWGILKKEVLQGWAYQHEKGGTRAMGKNLEKYATKDAPLTRLP